MRLGRRGFLGTLAAALTVKPSVPAALPSEPVLPLVPAADWRDVYKEWAYQPSGHFNTTVMIQLDGKDLAKAVAQEPPL